MKKISTVLGSLFVTLIPLSAFPQGKQSGSSLSAQDRMFVEKAAQGGMAEVKLGQLAGQKGQAGSVKMFGQRMVKDHSAANNKLMGVVKGLKITPPMDVDAKQKAAYQQLQSLRGSGFDKAYSKMMVQDHNEDIALFEKEAKQGSNAKLKSFASETLPTLRQHLSMAKSLPK